MFEKKQAEAALAVPCLGPMALLEVSVRSLPQHFWDNKLRESKASLKLSALAN